MRRAFQVLFAGGIVALSAAFGIWHGWLGWVFLAVGSLAGLGIWVAIRGLELAPDSYGRVMSVKYAASGLFVGFLAVLLALQASGVL
jgi:hypothetical protein